MLKSFVVFAVLGVVTLLPAMSYGQPAKGKAGNPSPASTNVATDSSKDSSPAPSLPPPTHAVATVSSHDSGCSDPSCETPAPHITVANAPPWATVPAPWPWQQRVSWAANLLLVVLAYVGLRFALKTLKAIERHTDACEIVARAAADSANTAALKVQSILNAERPWLLITIEPNIGVENSFRVIATNRGRSPAKVFASSARIGLASDETFLPKEPEYTSIEESRLPVPATLIPGDSMVVQPFGYEDVRWICKTADRLRRVETSQEKIFLFGRMAYCSLTTPDQSSLMETYWCARYVFGERSCGMVLTGSQEYNRHT